MVKLMDKMIDNNSLNHIINVNERKNILITGLNKIENFDSEEFLLNTTLGLILIKGQNLEIVKLDTKAGNVSIKGQIDLISYMDETLNSKEKGIFNKLFK